MADLFKMDITLPKLLESLECLTAQLIDFQKDLIKFENNRVTLDLEKLNTELYIIEKAYYELKEFEINLKLKVSIESSAEKLAYDSCLKIAEIHFDSIEKSKKLLENFELEQGIGQFFNLEKLKPPE